MLSFVINIWLQPQTKCLHSCFSTNHIWSLRISNSNKWTDKLNHYPVNGAIIQVGAICKVVFDSVMVGKSKTVRLQCKRNVTSIQSICKKARRARKSEKWKSCSEFYCMRCGNACLFGWSGDPQISCWNCHHLTAPFTSPFCFFCTRSGKYGRLKIHCT